MSRRRRGGREEEEERKREKEREGLNRIDAMSVERVHCCMLQRDTGREKREGEEEEREEEGWWEWRGCSQTLLGLRVGTGPCPGPCEVASSHSQT